MKELYVASCCRTAVGAFQGSLSNTPAPELGAVVVKEALSRAGVEPEQVDELMFGCILTAAQGQNVARQVGIKAGLPYSVPAYTVGMVCGSGMKSVIEGARAILAGDADIIVAGGTENMSAAPYALPDERWGARMGDKKVVDTMIRDGLWDAYNNYHMGTTAENICDVWGITRQELDEFAAASQQKAEAAQKTGRFEDEIVPVMVKKKKELVESGEIDCIMGCFSMEGRLDDYRWAGPYIASRQVVAVNESSDIYKLSDLEGKNLAVQSTTKPEGIFLNRTDERIPKLGNLISLGHRELIYTFLGKGYVDAVAAHEESIVQYMKDDGISFRILEEPLMITGIGVAFAKEDERGICEQMDQILEEMRQDGTSLKIIEKYLDDPEKYLEVDNLGY